MQSSQIFVVQFKEVFNIMYMQDSLIYALLYIWKTDCF